MTTDELERQLRSALRETLDHELGPHLAWAASPAAQRAAELDRRRRRWPLRVLAVAALIGAGGAAALLAGAPNQPAEAQNGWIAFTVAQPDPAGADDDLDIWLVALDRDARRAVGTDSDRVDQLCPAFAPDGRSLAYGRAEGHGTEHFMDADGVEGSRPAAYRRAALVVADVSDEGRVSDRLAIDVGDELPPPCPVWSPDGERLAFGVPRTSPINPDRSGAGSEVWVVRLSDRDVTVLPDLLATDLEWSPDGSVLAIAGGPETAAGDGVRNGLQDARIHLYELSTRTLRTLDAQPSASSLTWSPDGQHIAYARTRPTDDSRNTLEVIDVETGLQEVLTDEYRAVHGVGPVWSPDGERIVYQRVVGCCEEHEVVLVTPDDRSAQTGLAREVVITPEDTGRGLYPWRVTWSPDSRYLLYLAWSFPTGCCGEGMVEQMSFVAVPADLDSPSVLLTDMDGMVAYDGYDDTTFVPIQIWGRD
jgi:Tol biopolymer transport system component